MPRLSGSRLPCAETSVGLWSDGQEPQHVPGCKHGMASCDALHHGSRTWQTHTLKSRAHNFP